MTFVETKSGLINLAHVARITGGWRKEQDDYLYVLHGADGTAELATRKPMDWADLTAPVVQAAPGTEVIQVQVHMEKGRPTEADVDVDRQPVAARRITSNGAVPILIEDQGGYEGVQTLHPLPDGKIARPYIGWPKNLEAAKAETNELRSSSLPICPSANGRACLAIRR